MYATYDVKRRICVEVLIKKVRMKPKKIHVTRCIQLACKIIIRKRKYAKCIGAQGTFPLIK
jgi:hypothetical protein